VTVSVTVLFILRTKKYRSQTEYNAVQRKQEPSSDRHSRIGHELRQSYAPRRSRYMCEMEKLQSKRDVDIFRNLI
jgi:hypothetical protein